MYLLVVCEELDKPGEGTKQGRPGVRRADCCESSLADGERVAKRLEHLHNARRRACVYV